MRRFCIRAAVMGALAAAPLAAQADIITYDFTGTVIDAEGIYGAVADGSVVTGTYNFDFAAGAPSQAVGTPGLQTRSWMVQNDSGPVAGVPPSTRYVFTSTANVAGISYATDPALANGYDLTSRISGNTGNGQFIGYEGSIAYDGTGSHSSLELQGAGGVMPWTLQGLPELSASRLAFGEFDVHSPTALPGRIVYDITSLTPIPTPLPAGAWLLLSGLGAMGVMGRRRRQEAAVLAAS